MLASVAQSDPAFHCLIDSGAMITGYSNQQVAEALLRLGLPHVEGCVFIDEHDNQMVVLRNRGNGGAAASAVPLHQCGLSVANRFTFYDQVHATGTDIKQAPGARAAVTVSKDMTFRDCACHAHARVAVCRLSLTLV